MANVTDLTKDNFEEEVIKSATAVLVDFWAPWCGPCKALGPVVEAAAAKLVGQVKVARVNVDEQPELASRYQIRSIPTLIVFKGGQTAATLVGFMPEEQLLEKVKQAAG
jgi:thioredoxin 1